VDNPLPFLLKSLFKEKIMEIQTMSIVVGGAHCNAKCPYCISKMTGLNEVKEQYLPTCKRNLYLALSHARIGNVTTLLFTGKGEPTLYPDAITKWLIDIVNWENQNSHFFPYIELQTNGIAIANGDIDEVTLKEWYSYGLTTISISVAHYDYEFNKSIFTPEKKYINLAYLISKLKALGFNVRVNCTLLKDGIDSLTKIQNYISFCNQWAVDQITFRPMRVPSVSRVSNIYSWAKNNLPDEKFLKELHNYFDDFEQILTLAHGAKVYDVDGVAVCLSDCLTKAPEDSKSLRQLILYGDGRLTYDWQYKAAQLLPPEQE